MPAIARRPFSASTNGKGIKVTQTASAGDTIHTAVNSPNERDEIWLYAVNSDTTDRLLTVQWGGTSAPDNSIQMTVVAQSGLILIIPGLILQGGLVVKAFAATANVIIIYGFVDSIEGDWQR